MKAKITTIILLLSVIALSGCLSTSPDKALRTISQWIPPGTPQEDAIRIMKQHGYESGPSGRESWHPKDDELSEAGLLSVPPGTRTRQSEGEAVFCFWHETKILKNSRWFFVHFKNGKVDSIDGWGTGNDFFMGHCIPSRG